LVRLTGLEKTGHSREWYKIEQNIYEKHLKNGVYAQDGRKIRNFQ